LITNFFPAMGRKILFFFIELSAHNIIFVSQPSRVSFDLEYFLNEDNHTGGGVKIAIFGQSIFY
jgi:hypothetical protein